MNKINRRKFLKHTSIGLGGLTVFGSAVVSASVEKEFHDHGKMPTGAFLHGVASGDPLQDAVIIWTRVTPEKNTHRIPVGWEVASDPEFNHLIRRGRTVTGPTKDYTIKVDLIGLEPETSYYYRFSISGLVSPVGETRTLPMNGVSQVKLAVMSCANYPAGYFNAYSDAANIPNLDAVVHLGDYIYEYGEGGYATENANIIGRGFETGNNKELLRLKDYRKRYAQYRTDAGLQMLHANVPFICVWDDHEVANDTWKDGAENHNKGEGVFWLRKRWALRAYYEWMPVRIQTPGNKETIYRQFKFGDLVNLMMLDTRIIGRDKQLDYSDYIDSLGDFDANQFLEDVSSTDRNLLGEQQLSWLQNELFNSDCVWQVLGQQVLMGRMLLPAELLTSLNNPGPELAGLIIELATLKARYNAGDPSLNESEVARISTLLPYNLDAWDGYAAEREFLLETASTGDKNLVVLAGDTHNAWANNLKSLSGTKVGVEFATSSVTSPGLEQFLSIPEAAASDFENVLALLIDELQYLNIFDRGYMIATFTDQEATAEWVYVDNIDSPEYQIKAHRGKKLKVLPGAAGREIIPT